MEGGRLGRHGLGVVTQDIVEAMDQMTVTIDQSEKERGTSIQDRSFQSFRSGCFALFGSIAV